MVKCMISLREKGSGKLEPVGTAPFGRIPIVGEYIVLRETDSPVESKYKVTAVVHCGFSANHQAELYVVAVDSLYGIGGED